MRSTVFHWYQTSMDQLRILMIGGFLGAGKTTALAQLARHYMAQGRRVALVTNDQAYGLVDTESLRAQGFDVGEVPGACFCCKFDDLVETIALLAEEHRPEIVLTEPVGSCTDLMATVIRPLNELYPNDFSLGPLVVFCKPEHGEKILTEGRSGFSPQAAYIFRKQLEEADAIVLNKIDKLSEAKRDTLLRLLAEHFPGKPILAASARSGEGIEALAETLDAEPPRRADAVEVDYDIYAAGEAEMGWLNATVRLEAVDANQPAWLMDQVAIELTQRCRTGMLASNQEPGHLKVLASAPRADGGLATAVVNWVASDAPVELSVASGAEVQAADLLVNARVAGAPEEVARLATEAAEQTAAANRLQCRIGDLQQFRPARPEPTHRT